MEITKFDSFAICSDTVQATKGDFTVTILLDHDHEVTPYHFDCHSEIDKQRWRDDEWFYGMLRAKVSVDVEGQSVLLDGHAAILCGVEVNIANDNSHLDEHAEELAQEAYERGVALINAIKSAA